MEPLLHIKLATRSVLSAISFAMPGYGHNNNARKVSDWRPPTA